MLACVLHYLLPVRRTDDVAGPSGSAQHLVVLVVCCDPGAMLEQMWHKTGVPPSAWLRAARFDSSLGLVRAASGAAPQVKRLMARTVAYPYGMAILTHYVR